MKKRSAMLGESGYERIENEAYFTQPRCTQALIGAIGGEIRGPILEPAAGRGDMLEVFRAAGFDITGRDIADHGNPAIETGHNFLAAADIGRFRTVATNPPYLVFDRNKVRIADAEMFARHALRLTRPIGGQVVMILRADFYHAKSRGDLFAQTSPFRYYLPLGFRPNWVWHLAPEKRKEENSPRINYAWFVWDWSHGGPAESWQIPAQQSTLFGY